MRRQQNFGFGRKVNQIAAVCRSFAISAKGFSFLNFRLAQGRVGCGVSRVAGQMVATQSFDRDDLAFAEKLGCAARSPSRRQRESNGASARKYFGPQSGQATGCAWNRRLAGRDIRRRNNGPSASRASSCSAGRRASEDDAVARSAVRAVDVGISVSLIGWVKEFCKAIVADRQIRRDANVRPLGRSLSRIVNSLQTFARCGFHLQSLRCIAAAGGLTSHLSNKCDQILFAAFQMNLDPLLAVEHPPR